MEITEIIKALFLGTLALGLFFSLLEVRKIPEEGMWATIVNEFKKNLILALKENCEFNKLIETGMNLLHEEKELYTFSELCKLKEVELSCLVKKYSDRLSELISKLDLPEKINLAQLYKADAVEVRRVKDKIVLCPVKIGESSVIVHPDFYIPLREILEEVFKDNSNVVIGEIKYL